MHEISKIKEVVSKYGKRYGVKSVYLFGSYARGEATEQSDIDLLIEKGDLKTYDQYSDLKFAIEDELRVNVDLLTTDGIKPRFFDFIKNDRILLYGA